MEPLERWSDPTTTTPAEIVTPLGATPGPVPKPTAGAAGDDPLKGRLALSVRETATALGLSDKTIRRLINRGLLRVSRSLRHILIPRTEIDRFLKATLDLER